MKVLPVCRCAWVTRSYWLWPYARPPTNATMAPVFGSSATSAPCSGFARLLLKPASSFARPSDKARCAIACSRTSSEVRTTRSLTWVARQVVAVRELFLHELDEVRRLGCVERAGLHHQRRLLRACPLGVGDEARILHRAQHHGAPLLGALGMTERVVGVGRLDHAGEQRRFLERQVGHVLAEVRVRRLAHAVDAERADLTEVDLVQVQLEDLLLGGMALEDEGDERLLHLALHGALRREEEVLHQLLGDGAAALDIAVGA